MNPDHIARLLWQEQDGSLSQEERQELHEALADRPELELERKRIVEVGEKLSAVEPVEVPAELESLIEDWTAEIAARGAREPRRAPAAHVGRPGWGRLWSQRLAWAAMGAAAALLAVAVLTADFGVEGLVENDVFGAMAESAGEQRFEAQGVALRLSRSGDLLQVEIDGAAGDERLDVVGDGLELASFELLEGSLAEIARAESVFQVLSREDSAYDLGFRIGEEVGTVVLRVSRGSEVLIEREIRLGESTRRGP